MRPLRLGFLAAILVLAFTSPKAQAQNVLDQQQTNADCTPFSGFSFLNLWAAQTFQTSVPNVSGAGFYLNNFAGSTESGTVQIDLWDGNPSIAGTMLAGASGSATIAGSTGGWFDLFWTPVPVLPNTTYWLTIFGGNGAPDLVTACAPSAYSNGGVYSNGSSSETTAYNDFFADDLDLAFRTYTEAGNVVPEPATMTLLATGLVGLVGAGMRRRRKA